MNGMIGVASADTELLAERIMKLAVGELLSYGEIAKLLGYSAQSDKGRSRLGSARRIALRQGCVTECVTNEGIRRIDGADVVRVVRHAVGHVHRHASRQARKLKAATYETLTPDEKRAWVVQASLYGALSLMSGSRAIDRLDKRLAAGDPEQLRRLSSVNTLKLFTSNGVAKA